MGRFTDAAAGIDQALHRGMSAHPDEAMHTAVFQRLLLFLQQEGPVEELRPPLEQLEADRPDDKIYSCLLARIDCELGQKRQAQARLNVLDRDGFGVVRRHGQWLLAIGLLAEVAAMVGNPEQVKTLYELLRPYSAHVAGSEHIRIGCVSRYLGLLAAALSRFDEAATFLRDAVEANDRIGALPWSAYSSRSCSGAVGSGCARRPRSSGRPSPGSARDLSGARNDCCCRQDHRRRALAIQTLVNTRMQQRRAAAGAIYSTGGHVRRLLTEVQKAATFYLITLGLAVLKLFGPADANGIQTLNMLTATAGLLMSW